MSMGDFEKHITDVAPAFRCYACGDHREELNLTARLNVIEIYDDNGQLLKTVNLEETDKKEAA
jgi:hypothetical protein